jgi:hypothetical protein
MGAHCSKSTQVIGDERSVLQQQEEQGNRPARPRRRGGFLVTESTPEDGKVSAIVASIRKMSSRGTESAMPADESITGGRQISAALDQYQRNQFPLVLDDESFEMVRGLQARQLELIKCGSHDFEANFCMCENHWSNRGNDRGVYGNSVLPNWIQITGLFSDVPSGSYLVYWHVKYESAEGERVSGKWGLGVHTGGCVRRNESGAHDSLRCGGCYDDANTLALSYLDASPMRSGDCGQWRRLALGIVEVGAASTAVHCSFGWNPRWPRSFSLCHAGLLRLSLSWEHKRVLLLGMDRRKQGSLGSGLTRLNADAVLLIIQLVM